MPVYIHTHLLYVYNYQKMMRWQEWTDTLQVSLKKPLIKLLQELDFKIKALKYLLKFHWHLGAQAEHVFAGFLGKDGPIILAWL